MLRNQLHLVPPPNPVLVHKGKCIIKRGCDPMSVSPCLCLLTGGDPLPGGTAAGPLCCSFRVPACWPAWLGLLGSPPQHQGLLDFTWDLAFIFNRAWSSLLLDRSASIFIFQEERLALNSYGRVLYGGLQHEAAIILEVSPAWGSPPASALKAGAHPAFYRLCGLLLFFPFDL